MATKTVEETIKTDRPKKTRKTRSKVPPDVERAQKRAERMRLVRIKEEVKELERDNWSSIIAFTSGYPWFKVGFNSALIYEFMIAPHFREAPYKVHTDTDYSAFSRTGIISIGDIVRFAEILSKFGVEIPEKLKKYFEDGKRIEGKRPLARWIPDYYVFEIPGASKAKVKTFMEAQNSRDEDLNKLIMPYYIPQSLYKDARDLAWMIADLTRRFPVELRNTYGLTLANLTIAIMRDINVTCNGYANGAYSFGNMLNKTIFRAAEVMEIIRILMDSRILKENSAKLVIKTALKIQADAKEEIKRMQNKGTNPVVEAIKLAHDFPKTPGVDLSSEIKAKDQTAHGYIEA